MARNMRETTASMRGLLFWNTFHGWCWLRPHFDHSICATAITLSPVCQTTLSPGERWKKPCYSCLATIGQVLPSSSSETLLKFYAKKTLLKHFFYSYIRRIGRWHPPSWLPWHNSSGCSHCDRKKTCILWLVLLKFKSSFTKELMTGKKTEQMQGYDS